MEAFSDHDDGILTLTVFKDQEREILERKYLRKLLNEIFESITKTHESKSTIESNQDSFLSNLRLRDLMRLDPTNGSSSEKTITVRKHAVIFSMVQVTNQLF